MVAAIRDSEGVLEEPEVFDQFPAGDQDGRDDALSVARLARESAALRPWQQAVVRELLRTGNVTKAAAVGNIHLRSLQRWRKQDAAFNEACCAALEAHVDEVEENLMRRSKGESERLIEFTLKTRRRETYGERVEITGAVTHVHLTGDAWQAMLAEARGEKTIEAEEVK